MNVIHEIKDRLDIVALAGEYLQLQRSGANWKANCPFHADKNPSFVIFPASQRFTCFGAGCHQSGDLIDLVQRLNRWDFPSTLRHLAERAGVALAPLSQAEQAQQQARQEQEAVFSAAMGYFQSYLFRPAPSFQGAALAEVKPDLGYALGRGWRMETLAECGIGSFGADREGLRRALKSAGLDMEHPAVVALLGRRGGVAEWAQKYGVQVPQSWIKQERVPGMPHHMLIYPHLERGRVVYLSGRAIEGMGDPTGRPQHWNPPRQLAGPRRPYYNVYWDTLSQPVRFNALIVEGQGDALTLAQWELPAVALVGCSLPDPARMGDPLGRPLNPTGRPTDPTGRPTDPTDHLYPPGRPLEPSSPLDPQDPPSGLIGEILRRACTAHIVLALDSDEAGLKGSLQAAERLVQAGLPADQVHLLRWPVGDANDWLVAGAEASQALELVQAAPTWLDELLRRAASDPRDVAPVMALFQALSALPRERLLLHRPAVCAGLKMSKTTFDELGRTAQQRLVESSVEEAVDSFLVSKGCIYLRGYNAQGCQQLEKLSNFTARIVEEIQCDDGQQVEIELLMEGQANGRAMPAVRVPAAEFEDMKWVAARWGADPIIKSSARRSDQLREAIQYLSAGKQKRQVYTHTGWRALEDGQRVYLSGCGALGGPNPAPGAPAIGVELDSDLRSYRLPLEPHDPLEAMRASLQFLELAPLEISAPIWASVWLAPLSELVQSNFVVWLFGRTGTLKSSLAALALNHYGAGFDGFHFPANFTDTPYRLEHKAFLAKDALLVVDDYAPQKSQRDAEQYRRAASHLIRSAGNRAGRGRLSRELKAQRSYTPRGLVMVTGEELPDTESLLARLFVVEFKDESVDRGKLSALQAQRERLPHAMAGYLGWLSQGWQSCLASIPEQWSHYRQQATGGGWHLRLPETVASLMMGWDTAVRYALSIKAISGEEYARYMQQGWVVLLENCARIAQHASQERPEQLFLSTLRELLAQGAIYLRDKDGLRSLGGADERAEMLGWHDQDYLYLLPRAAYTRICRHFRDQGSLFPVQLPTLAKGLKEAGWLLVKDGRTTPAIRLEGKVQRVMVLKRTALEETEE
jgi:DNA primase